MDETYYVGYKIGNTDIGLVLNGIDQGMIGVTTYYNVSDIKQSLQTLCEEGAQVAQEARDVGVASL